MVTGKSDIRAAAANLRDEADEPEDFDGIDALAEGEEATDLDLEETEA